MLTKKNIHAYQKNQEWESCFKIPPNAYQLNISPCVKASAGYYHKFVFTLLLTVCYRYPIDYEKSLTDLFGKTFPFFVPQRWILFFISFFYNSPVDDIPKCGDMVRSFVLIV